MDKSNIYKQINTGLIFALTLCLFVFTSSGQTKSAKIGLTLSGGGAKGLAHIGILQALDSAGLKVDAISGTSMGAVMGSLYAVGYSGKELETLARNMDWTELFTGVPQMQDVAYLQKEDYAKYPLKLPLEKGKFKPYTGIFEAQGIWREFGILYFPVYDISDFSEYDIPFKAIATNLSDGNVTEFKQGDIITAVRASMAIPSIFTAVEYQGQKYVDGGVVQNFPVSALDEFDIDYHIGVNVASGLRDADSLKSALDVLLQIAFYKDAENFEQQKEQCDLIIEPKLGTYSTGSFGFTDSIIDIGIELGKLYYPIFKKLADSLNNPYNGVLPIPSRYPKNKTIIVDSVLIPEVSDRVKSQFKREINLPLGRKLNAEDFDNALNRAYSSLNYRKISYHFEPTDSGRANIVYDIISNPSSFINVGLHYTEYASSSILLQLDFEDSPLNHSHIIYTLNISENFRTKLKYRQFINRNNLTGLEVNLAYDFFDYRTYRHLDKSAQFRTNYTKLDLNLFRVLGPASAVGTGISREWINLKPNLQENIDLVAKNSFWYTYAYLKKNTLNRRLYPSKGSNISLEGGLIFNQNPSKEESGEYNSVALYDSLNTPLDYYTRIYLKMQKLIEFNSKLSLISALNAGINFNSHESYLNYFGLGGRDDYLRNQITFAGLKESQLITNSVVSAQIGLQYQAWNNIFIIARANSALHDFINLSIDDWSDNNLLSAYSLAIGYGSIIGPIELSLFYDDYSHDFSAFVSIGYPF